MTGLRGILWLGLLLTTAARADLLSTAAATVTRGGANNCRPQQATGTIHAAAMLDRCFDTEPGVTDPPIIGPVFIEVTTDYGYGKIYEGGSSEADGVALGGLSEFTEFVNPSGSGAGMVRLAYDYNSCGITGFDPANPCVDLAEALLTINHSAAQVVPGNGIGSLFFDIPVSDLAQPLFITSDFSFLAQNIHGPHTPDNGETLTITLESVTGVPEINNSPEPSLFLLILIIGLFACFLAYKQQFGR